MYITTKGIVLRETVYQDKDKLMTVLTHDLGKITVKAPGAGYKRSLIRAACQLMAYSEMTIFEQKGKYILTEADAVELFPELREDLEHLSLASYFMQVTEFAAQEEDPQPELLSLLLNTLYALAKLSKPQTLVKAAFEMRMCSLIGFLPDLEGCAICGKVEPDRFNITQGVLQCANCGNEQTEGIRMPIDSGLLAALRYICYAEPKKLFSFSLAPHALKTLGSITEAYLCMRLERGFYTLDFYKSLLFEARP